MKTMKNSGIPWIKEIPLDWEICRVSDAFFRKNRKAYQLEPTILTLARSGIKIRDISSNEGQIAESYYEYNPVSKNDLLLNPMDLQSGDNCSISKVEGVISPAYINLRHKTNISPDFYNYLFKVYYWTKALFTYGKGVSFDNRWTLNYETLSHLKIVRPKYEEQLKIANYLDKRCGEIDGLISDIKREIETLSQYKKSIITETVTKGLNNNIKLKSTDIKWADKIPEHWEVIPNKYLMKKIKNICPKYTDEKILSLTMNGVIIRDLDAGGKIPTSFDGYQIVKPGNLLMCLFDIDVTPRCVGLIKDYGLTSPAYSQFVMKEKSYAPYYYYYYLMLDYTKELLHLAKNLRHSFTEEQLGTINTPVPPIQEQKEIAEYLDKKCKEIDSILEDKNKQLEILESYKKSIIYEYVTGKKEVVDD